MAEFPRYLQALKDRYRLTSDYALARKLGIAQPEVNLIRRGLKVPKPELCIKIANLLDNAIKYTPAGGSVEVAVNHANNDAVAITVKDTGIGISKEDMSRIFERFYRCDPSRSEAGIGLGLSFARAIAKAHGGDISVTSELNQGSTFTIILPKTDFQTIIIDT